MSEKRKRPRFTRAVRRGLYLLATSAPVVEVLNSVATLDEIQGYADQKDIDDAYAASEWIMHELKARGEGPWS